MTTSNIKHDRYIVIMAGGSGTRMGSTIPKQLHALGNKPMMLHLMDNACQMNATIVLVVSAKNKEIIINTLTTDGYFKKINETCYCYAGITIHICVQPIANGTGGALMATTTFFSDKDSNSTILILSADVPLITQRTMLNMFEKIENTDGDCVILAKDTINNFGYGRIIVNNGGEFIRIVEQKDCTDEEKRIKLITTGTYSFRLGSLMESLKYLNCNNSQKEYYLTDCPKIIKLRSEIDKTNLIRLIVIDDDCNRFDETIGANTPDQLMQLRKEYIKKFTIEEIGKNDINLTDYNLKNLIKVLDQLSPFKKMIQDINKIRKHINDTTVTSFNQKYLYIIRYEDTIIGTGSILIEEKLIHDMGKVSHIEDIVIDSNYRGLGLAKNLMIELIEFSKRKGCYKIILSAASNVETFYEKLGFEKHSNSMRLDI